MDHGAEWMPGFLQGYLPDTYLQFLHSYVLHQHAPFQALRRRAAAHAKEALAAAYPVVEPAMDRVARALHNSPDVVVLAFVVVLLVLVLQVLAWLRRLVVWWTRLAFRILFWACVVGLVAFVWQRGVEASLRDAVVLGSEVAGYLAAVRDIWVSEYRKYEAQGQAPGGSRSRGGTGTR